MTEVLVAQSVICGPDIDRHLERIRAYADAGVDELYIQQIGLDHDAFFDAYREQVLPQFG